MLTFCLKRKNYLLLFVVIIFLVHFCHPELVSGSAFCENKVIKSNQDFVIVPSLRDDVTKKMSKNELKENIGLQVRDVLNQCAELNKQIGQIQIQLSEIEQQLFEKIEKLIDNKPPFKKAGRGELSDSYKILFGVKKELVSQVDRVKRLSVEINKNSCLKS